jgi:outer membrane protein assembly factor BamB
MTPIVVCCGGMVAMANWLLAAFGSPGPVPLLIPVRAEPAVIWQVPEEEGRGTPAVSGQTAFFLTRRHDVVAVDAATGRVKWRRSTGGSGEDTAGSTVLATDRMVIAGDYDVVAFDHQGRWRWRFAPRNGYGAGIYLGAASEGVAFAGSPSGHLFAIDTTSGAERWSVQVGEGTRTTVFAPVAGGPVVVAGFTSFDGRRAGGVVAVRAATGRVLWRRTFAGTTSAPGASGFAGGPLLVDDLVLAAGDDGSIHAIDRRTGAPRWCVRPTRAAGASFSVPDVDHRPLARVGRVLVAGSLTGAVTAYDLDTRNERWRKVPLDSSVAFGIASGRRTVYVPYFSGRLVALRASDGQERWRTRDGGWGLNWTPLPFPNGVFAAGSGAGFLALQELDG